MWQQWGPTIVTGLFMLFGCAVAWGTFAQATRANTSALAEITGPNGPIAELKKSRGDMWHEINEHGERITAVEAACKVRHGVSRANGGVHV